MVLRKAVFSDCKSVHKLICELEGSEVPFTEFTSIFKNQLKDSQFYCLVCETEGKVVGVLNLRIEEQLHHAQLIAEIMEFVVDSRYRSHGIGKEMFAKACQVAKNFDCTLLEVTCNQKRVEAHRFYKREGMENSHFKFTKVL